LVTTVFFKKTDQEKFPIQIQYHFKESLQEYYAKFNSGLLEKPDFSCVCPICGASGCSVYHGYYTRAALCPVSGFDVDDFPVMRFKCCSLDKAINSHVTFSLLPVGLVPYRKVSLLFMVMAVWLRISHAVSLFKTMDIIESELNKLEDAGGFLSVSALCLWSNVIGAAYAHLLSRNTYIRYEPNQKSVSYIEELNHFVEYIVNYKRASDHHQIRGPDALALEFFNLEHIFLFGVASQDRAR
jgi:hypothetical protein